MVGPIILGWKFARQLGQSTRQEFAKRSARGIDVTAIAVDEIHGHGQRVVDVPLKAHAGFEYEGQHAGARLVRVAPYLAAEGQKAVWLAVAEGRTGKDRR